MNSERDPLVTIAAPLLGLGVAAVGVAWGGATLAYSVANMQAVEVSLAQSLDALPHLAARPDEVASAWPTIVAPSTPGPVLYWAASLVVAAAMIASGVLIGRVLRAGRTPGSGRRRRLGVDAQARFARRRDLRPLIVRRPVVGRLVLGRVRGRLVATEDRRVSPQAWRWRARERVGDRSSVAIIGPTRCGKTAGMISGILEWTGPAILASVKSDLLAATHGWRSRQGDVRVFDPTGATSYQGASWSPLRAATTITGAQQVARALGDAGPKGTVENLDFFTRLAEGLLWPHLYIAAVTDKTMADVVGWIFSHDMPTDTEPGAVGALVEEHLRAAADDADPGRMRDALGVYEALCGVWRMDDRTRSNTYATAQTLIGAWADPTVAATSTSTTIDLEWLTSGNNTLYLCAPLHEQARLAPVLGGLLGDLIQQAYQQVTRTNAPIPTLLVVMDEAGNTPTRWLPPVASTCAGIGILLVTIWQSKAQIDAAYGRLADSVLTNHGTKVIYSGVSDPATLDYTSRLLGDEHVTRRAISTDHQQQRSVSEATHAERLVPAHLLRQVRPGEALLIHQTLPPAHLISRPYYRDRHLTRRATTPTPSPAEPREVLA